MITSESTKNTAPDGSKGGNVCDLKYLTEMMGNKNHLIVGIMDAFLKQIPEELHTINIAVEKTDYPGIKSIAHTMKSSVSIMGISTLAPLLQEIENFGASASGIEKIKVLNKKLIQICAQAIAEVQAQKLNYLEI